MLHAAQRAACSGTCVLRHMRAHASHRKIRARACREDALKRSEEMLEGDAVKFDQFLRENETKVNDTIKAAEAQAKRRADRQVRASGRLARGLDADCPPCIGGRGRALPGGRHCETSRGLGCSRARGSKGPTVLWGAKGASGLRVYRWRSSACMARLPPCAAS